MDRTNKGSVCVSKKRRGHLVKWVEKSSFTRLNKLFEIDQVKQNHNMLLIEKNLKVILVHLKSFVIPIFSRLASMTLVSTKHFMLKDLSFYEVAQLADVEAR